MSHKYFSASVKIEQRNNRVYIEFGENEEIVVSMSKEQFANVIFGKAENVAVMIDENLVNGKSNE